MSSHRALRVYVQIDDGPVREEASAIEIGVPRSWTGSDLQDLLHEVRFDAAEVVLTHHLIDEHNWTRDQCEAQTYEQLVENHRQIACGTPS